MGVMGLVYWETKWIKKDNSHQSYVSLILSRSEALVMNYLLLSLITSFSGSMG